VGALGVAGYSAAGWAVSTVTTVGYGDIYPHSTAGRIVAIVVMFAGIGFVTLITGAAAQRFLTPQVEALGAGEEQIEAEVAASDADLLNELRDIGRRIEKIEQRLASR
jgi:voltage-gated potassium channel